jgi:hypothetical protein
LEKQYIELMDLLHKGNVAVFEVGTDLYLPLVINVEGILVLLGSSIGIAY